jgi:hypothetical protein
MGLTEVFIIRVYRRNPSPEGALVGTVETVPNRRIRKFENCEELCYVLEILRRSRRPGKRVQRPKLPSPRNRKSGA